MNRPYISLLEYKVALEDGRKNPRGISWKNNDQSGQIESKEVNKTLKWRGKWSKMGRKNLLLANIIDFFLLVFVFFWVFFFARRHRRNVSKMAPASRCCRDSLRFSKTSPPPLLSHWLFSHLLHSTPLYKEGGREGLWILEGSQRFFLKSYLLVLKVSWGFSIHLP